MVGKEAGLEYKTASAYSSGKWKDGEISPHVDQIQTNDKQTKSGVIDAFMDCIVHGKEAQLSGKSVLSAMEAVFASIESAKTGKTIKIG